MPYIRCAITVVSISLVISILGPEAFQTVPRAVISGLSFAQTKPYVPVDWQLLRELDYRTGKMSVPFESLLNKQPTVRIPGFMIPLEDNADAVTEFLLVPYFMACVHVPPPPPNQLVHAKMARTKKQQIFWDAPIWVHGQLRVTVTSGPYGEAAYTMAGELVEPYR